jgi:uroporphyrinogen decarboxylase
MTKTDTLMLKALRREPVPRPPVWLMRQAGRYLPEYQEVRRKAGGFLAMCHDPELAAEVTLQPVRRFGMDAAILFSDILLPLAAMGMPLEFQDGRGPVLPKPLRTADDVDALKPVEPEQSLGYVGDALECTAAGLPSGTTLLGFCGAPYTLASYAVEGGTSKAHATVRQLMYREPAVFEKLMGKLAETSGRHLAFQASRGAQAVVLFDTWAGTLGREDYLRYALPHSKRALEIVGDAVPRIHFVLNGQHVLEDIVAAGSEAVAVDWRVSIADCIGTWGDKVAFQGNLDPSILLGTPELVVQRTREILDAVGGRAGHVMGLGHGVHKETDPECVAAFVDTVKAAASVAGVGGGTDA